MKDDRPTMSGRVNTPLMLCGVAVQVIGLCWLPSNLHPEDGLGVSDFEAFFLVLTGAALVGVALVIRACERARVARRKLK